MILPGAAASGIEHWTNTAGVVTASVGAVSLTADVSGVLPVANGGSPAIANTTTTVGITTLAANTCSASATTVTMTGLTTASTFAFTPTTDASGITGWGANAGFAIDAWPTANTMNYKVCNQTAGSITSASITFNVSAR
jgi:hypothetical protein